MTNAVRTTSENDSFYMAGTEGTGEYIVIAYSRQGKVGYRELSNGNVRVCVEPKTDTALSAFMFALTGWTRPEPGRLRFSTVVPAAQARKTVVTALKALKTVTRDSGGRVTYAPSKVGTIFKKITLVAISGAVVAFGLKIFRSRQA